MTFDLISGLHMQIQTWHPPLWLCAHAKYYVKSGLTNVLKNANKTKNMHLFSIRIANYMFEWPSNAISRYRFLIIYKKNHGTQTFPDCFDADLDQSAHLVADYAHNIDQGSILVSTD